MHEGLEQHYACTPCDFPGSIEPVVRGDDASHGGAAVAQVYGRSELIQLRLPHSPVGHVDRLADCDGLWHRIPADMLSTPAYLRTRIPRFDGI